MPKRFREAAGVKGSEMITISVEKDTEPRVVEPPEDLVKALKKAKLKDVWEKLSYTHQKEYAQAIKEAKRKETRARRVEKTVKELAKRKK